MAGLVSSAVAQPTAAISSATAAAPVTAPSAPATASTLSNPVLAQVEQGIESKVTPAVSQMYHSIVMASMKLAFDPSTHGSLIQGLKSSPDVSKNVSLICAGIIGTVFHQTKQDINKFLPGAMPASVTLMCQILNYAEKSGMIQVTPDVVAQCATATSSAVLRKFGVDKGKVAQVVAAGKSTAAATPSQPAAGV